MKVEITRTNKPTKDYGMIARVVLPNKSKIYITKKGWNLVTPKGIEINVPYSELNLAIEETIKAGYVNTRSQTRRC